MQCRAVTAGVQWSVVLEHRQAFLSSALGSLHHCSQGASIVPQRVLLLLSGRETRLVRKGDKAGKEGRQVC